MDVVALVSFGTALAAASALVLGRGARRGAGRPVDLEGWALADRGTGTASSVLLVGGTVFTAYTFVAVPALVHGTGALGFFAVPYTVLVPALALVVLPPLWGLARRHGWATPSDAVRDRFGSPALSTAVALTGLLATMPYVALQLLGLSALLTAMGVPSQGALADVALSLVFAFLAVSTYRDGLRAPARMAAVKGVAVVVAVVALLVVVVPRLGGAAAVAAAAEEALAARGSGGLVLGDGLASGYATLALGSAAALLLYPHVLLPVLACRSRGVVRRTAVAFHGWVLLLALTALLGLVALAAGVDPPPGRSELAVPLLVTAELPSWAAGLVLAAVGVAALVPAAVMSLAAATQFTRSVYVEWVHPAASPEHQLQVARLVSVVVKLGALLFALALPASEAISLQLLGGVWILQTLPAVLLGLVWRWPHRTALLLGWAAGMVVGTGLVVSQGLAAVVVLPLVGSSWPVYAAVPALLVNVAVTAAATPLLDRAGAGRGVDRTRATAGAREEAAA